MRKFFETADHKLLEVNSELEIKKCNLPEFKINTSSDINTPYLPVIEKMENGYKVSVNVPNTQECCKGISHNHDCCANLDCCNGVDCCDENHNCSVECAPYFMFIELEVDGLRMRRYLARNEKPVVSFLVPDAKEVIAYSYSIQGGLWMYKLTEDVK